MMIKEVIRKETLSKS